MAVLLFSQARRTDVKYGATVLLCDLKSCKFIFAIGVDFHLLWNLAGAEISVVPLLYY